MKTTLTLILLTVILLAGKSQTVNFSYDESGNRIEQKIMIGLKSTQSLNNSLSEEAEYSDKIDETEIFIYPNPVNSYLNINISGWSEDLKAKIYLYDQNGRFIKSLLETSDNNILDFSGIPPGMYYLTIEINGKHSKWNVLKQ